MQWFLQVSVSSGATLPWSSNARNDIFEFHVRTLIVFLHLLLFKTISFKSVMQSNVYMKASFTNLKIFYSCVAPIDPCYYYSFSNRINIINLTSCYSLENICSKRSKISKKKIISNFFSQQIFSSFNPFASLFRKLLSIFCFV